MLPEFIPCPNLFLVAGTGRRTGKTTLVCAVLNKFYSQLPIIGLKISPHFHLNEKFGDKIIDHKHFKIIRETSRNSKKDSSLMLASGAIQAYYIETTDQFLLLAFKKFLELIPPDSPIVCESPALRKYIVPGIFIFMHSRNCKNPKTEIQKMIPLADKVINLNEDSVQNFLISVKFEKSRWFLLSE